MAVPCVFFRCFCLPLSSIIALSSYLITASLLICLFILSIPLYCSLILSSVVFSFSFFLSSLPFLHILLSTSFLTYLFPVISPLLHSISTFTRSHCIFSLVTQIPHDACYIPLLHYELFLFHSRSAVALSLGSSAQPVSLIAVVLVSISYLLVLVIFVSLSFLLVYFNPYFCVFLNISVLSCPYSLLLYS